MTLIIKLTLGNIFIKVKNPPGGVTVTKGEHITDTHISETDTTELENLRHNIIDIFIIET